MPFNPPRFFRYLPCFGGGFWALFFLVAFAGYLLLPLTAGAKEAQQIIYLHMGQDQMNNPVVVYRKDLLTAAFKAAGVSVSVLPCTFPAKVSDKRSALIVSADGDCDVIATSAGAEFTNGLQAVPFPIYLGGGGYRVLLTIPERSKKIAAVNDLADLRQLVIGSGPAWADTRILERNGIAVEKAEYVNLFPMLRAGRFDALSRSVFEVDSELNGIAGNGIVLEPRLLLHYNSDLFFYVGKHRADLHDTLLNGLQRMYCSGEMHRFIRNHDSTRLMWQNLDPAKRKVIKLDYRLSNTDEAKALKRYRSRFDHWRPELRQCH